MKSVISLLSCALLFACAPKNKIYNAASEDLLELEYLDTLHVTAPKAEDVKKTPKLYRAAAEQKFDLIHTNLDVRFDWEKQHVLGKAKLRLAPYFYAQEELVLDAKNFLIHSVRLDGHDLAFDYPGDKIWISLDKSYTRIDTFELEISYTARPNHGPEGGSDAIKSDKGLFFINPLNKEDKPQQIWTQGETENNSKWFPTIDKPNERCSQEIYITVQDRFKTLSNGLLISSIKNNDGTRTDYWKQDLAHAPYLFMMAIGEYAVVEDSWNDLPLYYYVEKEYEKDAKQIFNHTGEMIGFFSDLLDYPYAWDKYAQVVCRDYVSGAMENTGAVVFGEFVQRSAAELEDEPNDYIVAHELIHHWFGNLVTCESWANLTLNEGFANYGEYLWFEYKYGAHFAEQHRLNELSGYLSSSFGSSLHPLIHYQYKDKEHMFDAHSYNKGGLILHMLRSYVGDDAFFESLAYYLKKNAFTAVEADELRLAFEDITGKDLNWFFDQWFFNQGHPILEVNYDLDEINNQIHISVDQVQNTQNHLDEYILPVEIALYYADGRVEFIPKTIEKRNSSFSIPVSGALPELVVLDGKHDLMAVITENRSNEDYVKLFNYSYEFIDQFKAINNLRLEDEMLQLQKPALMHPFSYFRKEAIKSIYNEDQLPIVKQLLLSDPSAEVRSAAFEKLVEFDPNEALALSQEILSSERSYSVLGQTLVTLYQLDPENTLLEIEKIAENNPKPFFNIISDIYAASEDTKYLDFFKDNIEKVSIYELWNFTSLYVSLAENGSTQDLLNTASTLNENISDSGSLKKTLLMYNMGRIYKTLASEIDNNSADQAAVQVKDMMELVINNESDTELANQLRSYLN